MTGLGAQREFRGSGCPLGAPHGAGVGWGPVGGTLGRAKALPRIQAHLGQGALARSLSGGLPAISCPPIPACTPIPWPSCSSRGDPTPTSCLTAAKTFETTVMASGKILLGRGNPRQGIPHLLDGTPWMQEGSGRAPQEIGRMRGLILLVSPQIPALEWPWGTSAWLGLFPGKELARRL